MRSIVLYIFTVLIWGSTWLAIEFQLGIVPPEASLVYRFALAASIMWIYCLYKKLPMAYCTKDHLFFAVLALTNFGGNYLFLYWAQAYLSSAMTSIAFSTLLIMNMVNNRLFFGSPIPSRMFFGAGLGLLGIVALFWQDIRSVDFSSHAMIGLGLSLTGTLVASFGNMTSVRNSKHGVGVLQGNAWGMSYSAIFLTLYLLLSDGQFRFDFSFPYVASLLYLSVFGTVLAFAFYFILIKDIGAAKASYTVVLFPLVAVSLSLIFEGFVLTFSTLLGFVLVITGNIIVLTPLHRLKGLLNFVFAKQTLAP